MRLYTCDHCGQPVHFDNRACVKCGHILGFVPDRMAMHALFSDENNNWRLIADDSQAVRFCANAAMDICNWTVPSDSVENFCIACRYNRLVPNTGEPAGVDRWRRISQAQRHLFYSFLRWDLPRPNRVEDPDGGLVFDFLEDEVSPNGAIIPAMTGHDEGLIVIRAAEADDVTREQARTSMNEPYRTLLGHFRHESGHFIWNKLVRDRDRFGPFRAAFGDERQDYAQALQNHYLSGPRPDWQNDYISAYASTHPWEDFAETFAHYLHIVDTLETARAFGLAVDPRGHEEMAAEVDFNPYRARTAEQLANAWIPLSVALNSIHHSMGQPDLYPFVLSPTVIAKLEFIHGLIGTAAKT